LASEETEANKRIVRRYYEVFTGRDLAALDSLFASDFVGHSVDYGAYTLDDMRRGIAREHEDMPDDETIIEEQLAEGDRVVTRWRYRWKHDSPLFGERPTGEWLTMEGVQIDRVVGGKMSSAGRSRVSGASSCSLAARSSSPIAPHQPQPNDSCARKRCAVKEHPPLRAGALPVATLSPRQLFGVHGLLILAVFWAFVVA